MNSSLSGSTYILLTAKSSADTYRLSKLSLKEKMVVQVQPYDKKAFLPEELYFFHFHKFPDQLVDENAFENDLVS